MALINSDCINCLNHLAGPERLGGGQHGAEHIGRAVQHRRVPDVLADNGRRRGNGQGLCEVGEGGCKTARGGCSCRARGSNGSKGQQG